MDCFLRRWTCGIRRAGVAASLALAAITAPALGGEIYLRETFEAAKADGRVLPSDSTGVFPPQDIAHANSCYFAHDQGLIAAGLAGSRQALRAIDSSDGNSALRVDWLAAKPVPPAATLQFDMKLSGLDASPRVKSVVPFTLIVRAKDQAPIFTTMLHNDRNGFAVRTRAATREYELHGDGSQLLLNDREYRFVYRVDLTARKLQLTVTDPVSGAVVLGPTEQALSSALPAEATLTAVSVSFGSPDFASKAGAAQEHVTFDNLLVCDPDVKDGLTAAGTPKP
jgi:hypothetical protein